MIQREELLKLYEERKQARSYIQAKKMSDKIRKKLQEYHKQNIKNA